MCVCVCVCVYVRAYRDIKGQNILVDNFGVCKLADFGASRHMQLAESAQNMVRLARHTYKYIVSHD